jgi:hypothetical protein
MKIIIFQYNRGAAAIIGENTLGTTTPNKNVVDNSILANGYMDRLLREEIVAPHQSKKSEYIILGNWQ